MEAAGAARSPARRLPARTRRPGRRHLPHLISATVAATVAVGLAAEAAGVELGPGVPPFTVYWEPAVDILAVPALAVLVLAVLVAPRLLSPSIPPMAFGAVAYVIALASQLALAVAGGGGDGWYAVFDSHWEAANEYLPGLPALSYGVPWFLDRFAELVPSLPVHVAGHPPGLLLTLHALGIETAAAMAALTIAAGALAVPLTYLLGRRLLHERRARVGALLLLFAPSALLYGAASADALYAPLGLAAALGLVATGHAGRAVGAGLLALASFFSWALLAVGAWAALLVARRDGPRRAAGLAVTCSAALAGLYAVLHAATGYDPVGALAATEDVYRFSIAQLRPYAYWVLGSPAAFLIAAGVPVAWYAARSLAAGGTVAIPLAAVVGISALLGFTKAETERIWLFLVPFLCLAAASVMPAGRVGPVLALLLAQAVAAELLLDTIW